MAKEDMLGKVIRRLMDFPPEELGTIYDLLEKCTGKLNGKEWRGAVKEFLRRGPNKYWNIWKTIQLGTGLKNADQFRGALKNGGFKISDSADDIMEKIIVSSERVNLSLVIVTGKGLGFSNAVTIKEAYERAQVLGLKPCPSEAGPQLRLQYQGLPNGEFLLIAMEPIKNSNGRFDIFSVQCFGSVPELCAYSVGSDNKWDPDHRWIFAISE